MRKAIQKVLIANRGEIACRIIDTLNKMGIESIAVYSDADRQARHVQLATQAVHIGAAPAAESYLQIDKIIAAAKQTGADALHPGYGFLSENPLLAEACQENGIIFIGPPPAAIRAMGSKSAAKRIMEKSGVPLIPGYHGDDQDDQLLRHEATRIGYPVILKAALGGGGKGMRIVNEESAFNEALASCRREALSSFNDDTILIEKYIGQPRHVEIQVFCDQHGNAVHLFERDCSIQRRHQKIIEEAPAPDIPATLRQKMATDAIMAAKAIDYVGAGTVEFLYDGHDRYYFMEMNTRLQVEHPVTEMITGVDLVQWQIDVANGAPLPLPQSDITCNGHSIEVRLCAEDCNQNFMPSIGPLGIVQAPQGEHVRLDSGVQAADQISVYYDPMFAKLIVWGRNRQEAIQKMRKALRETCIAGIETNIAYTYGIIQSDAFASARLTTHFLADYHFAPPDENMLRQAIIAACLYRMKATEKHNLPGRYGWRLNAPTTETFTMTAGDIEAVVKVAVSGNKTRVTLDNGHYDVIAETDSNGINLRGDLSGRWIVQASDNGTYLFKDAHAYHVREAENRHDMEESDTQKKYTSPMPGVLTKLFVSEGATIEKDMPLAVVEAMKMEHIIHAKTDGIVEAILRNAGDNLIAGEEILRITA